MNTENFESFGPLSSKINTAGKGEGVKNSLKIWGAASLASRVDLPFHLFVLRGRIGVVGWRTFTDRGGKTWGFQSAPALSARPART